jgi:hypothetical protein
MAENSTQSGMQLLDLNDEDLLKIFSYLDHLSQVDTMLVCRRFEFLIGQTAQFYKKFKLLIAYGFFNMLNVEFQRDSFFKNKIYKRISNFGRYFGEVTIYNYIFSPRKVFFPGFPELTYIGSRINKLSIIKGKANRDQFLEVLQLATRFSPKYSRSLVENVPKITAHNPKP